MLMLRKPRSHPLPAGTLITLCHPILALLLRKSLIAQELARVERWVLLVRLVGERALPVQLVGVWVRLVGV